MNAPLPTQKEILPLADALRPALLKASRALRREAQIRRLGRAGKEALVERAPVTPPRGAG